MSRFRTVTAALLLTTTLVACGSNEEEEPQPLGDDRIVGKQWQVVGIYSNAANSARVSDSMVDVPHLVLGESTALGNTGCSRFVAKMSFTDDEGKAATNEAARLRFEEMDFDERDEECTGENAWAHNQLSRLFVEGNEFEIFVDRNNQMILTLIDGKVDSPSIRYAAM